MELPIEIRETIDGLTEGVPLRALSDAAERLSSEYRGGVSHGSRIATTRTDVLAYCTVRMPATFAAVSRALELSLEGFGGSIGSVLDLGAGTGAGALASVLLTGARSVCCVEREPEMMAAGKQLLERVVPDIVWRAGDLLDGAFEPADLVLCSYCLNEVSERNRMAVLDRLAAAAGKLLVIVEPGTPRSFGWMREARQALLARGMSLVAPCPNRASCELPGSDWCHFSARTSRTKLHKLLKGAEVPYEDEKFCFLAATPIREWAAPCKARVLRHPLVESGKITLRLCSETGYETRLVSKREPAFKKARKAKIGDSFGNC